MRKFATFSVLMSFLIFSFAAEKAGNDYSKLREELIRMQTIDQATRTSGDDDNMEKIDSRNLQRLKEIVAKHGWPTISKVGKDGAYAAWLIVQHADADKTFQLEVLEMMTNLLASNEVAPQSVAYLYDRTHQPQRYGTQGSCETNGQWKPREVVDETRIDEFRKQVGLNTIREYREDATKALCAVLP